MSSATWLGDGDLTKVDITRGESTEKHNKTVSASSTEEKDIRIEFAYESFNDKKVVIDVVDS